MDSQNLIALHRARFVQWKPAAIVALAPNSEGDVVALAREDGSIELLDAAGRWSCDLRIPGDEGAAITSLVWSHFAAPVATASSDSQLAACLRQRLFTAGLDGQVVEWDMQTLLPAKTSESYGGPVWRLAAEPAPAGDEQRFASACDDGCVRLYTVEDTARGGRPGVHYKKSFASVGKRMLSVAWTVDGEALVSGAADGCVYLWEASTGTELLRITAGSGGVRRDTDLCVWAVLALTDGTLVSGDSSGRVQFWDGATGTLLQGFHQHRGDVLALAATSTGTAVYASGIDVQLAEFVQLKNPDSKDDFAPTRWVYTGMKRSHSHDVRALAVGAAPSASTSCEVLYSGGVDTQLLAYDTSTFLQRHPVKVLRWSQKPLVQVALATTKPSPPLIMVQHPQWVNVWRLGWGTEGPEGATRPGSKLEVQEGPVHMARLKLLGGPSLTCAALSPSSEYAALSSATTARLFRLGPDPESAEEYSMLVACVGAEGGGQLPAARAAAFTPDSTRLLLSTLAPSGPSIQIVDASTATVTHSISDAVPNAPALPKHGALPVMLPALTPLAVSPDGQWAAGALAAMGGPGEGQVVVVHLEAGRVHARLSLPLDAGSERAPRVGCMAFSPAGDLLAVATAANNLHIFDVEAARLAPWSQANSSKLPSELLKMPGQIGAMSFSPKPPSGSCPLLLHTEAAICSIDLAAPLQVEKEAEEEGPKKKKRRVGGGKSAGSSGAVRERGWRVTVAEQVCLHVQHLGPASALLVECSWPQVLHALPPPLFRHRYGT